MEYAVQMRSDTMMYISILIKIGSDIQKLMEGDSQICRQHGNGISVFSFFQNRGIRLTILML
jgi:hypothetical protein